MTNWIGLAYRQPFLLETIIPSWYICSWRCTSWFYQKDRCRSGRRLDSYSANTWIFI